jgi:hypothetical protein
MSSDGYKSLTHKINSTAIDDGSFTSDLNETIQIMTDYLIPTDEQNDDRDYTPTEVKKAIEELNRKKAPGEDGITGEIYQRVYKQFPTFIYTLYNECLRKGCFPKKWKKVNTYCKTRERTLNGRINI